MSSHAGKQLDFHLEWAAATSGGAPATSDNEAVWRYVPEDGNHIDIRAVPSISGSRTHPCQKAAQHVPQSGLTDLMCRVEFGRTNERLMAGEVFRVSETFEGADGTLHLGLQGRNCR